MTQDRPARRRAAGRRFFAISAAAAVAAIGALPAGCAPEASPEPLALPDDPAASGVPVGVRTLQSEGITFEVWYPASDAVIDEQVEDVDLNEFIPQVFIDHLGTPPPLPDVAYAATRDADLRLPEAPYPVVVFSHGFGGFRLQSIDYARHLASRGYVVASADHPGRMLADVLPCLFSPQLDGCDLGGFGGDFDAAQPHVRALITWLQSAATGDGFLAGHIDPDRMGMSGHSAGGATTVELSGYEDAVDAALVMAMAGPIERDMPALYLEGSCDFVADGDDALASAADGLADARVVEVTGAGHMAFSDLCSTDLGGLADDLLFGRDDLNEFFLDQMLALATSGCPGYLPEPDSGLEDCVDDGFLDLETSNTIIRHYATRFFDAELKDEGPGIEAGVFPEAVVDGG